MANTAARVVSERAAAQVNEVVAGDGEDPLLDPLRWPVDLLSRQLITSRIGVPDYQVLRHLTGLESPIDAEGPDAWPSQRDVAERIGISRAQVNEVVERARARWIRKPWMTAVRDDVARLIDAHGGLVTREELAAALLLTRGSIEVAKGERLRRACAVLWAGASGGSGARCDTPLRVAARRAYTAHRVDAWRRNRRRSSRIRLRCCAGSKPLATAPMRWRR